MWYHDQTTASGSLDVSGSSTSIWSTNWTATWRRKGLLPFADSLYFHNKTRSGGYLNKESGERNFGFDYLKSRLNRDMEEKGLLPAIVSCYSTGESLHRDNPPLRVSLWKYQRRQRTWRSLVFSPNGSFKPACVIMLSVMRHNTNSRTVIQITEVYDTRVTVCVVTQ